MPSTLPLPAPHQRTYEMLLQNPMSPSLTWSAVRALLDEMAEVAEDPDGLLTVTDHSHSLGLRPPAKGVVLDAEQLARVREFVERMELKPARIAPGGDWLVVIEGLEAAVFRSVATGAVPQLVRSHEPDHAAKPPAPPTGRNGRKPRPPGFFEPLAGILHGARKILIFAPQATLGAEADRFTRWLHGYRPAIAQRIVASVPVGLDELTEAGLLAKARDLYRRVEGAMAESCTPPRPGEAAGDGRPVNCA